MLRKHQFVLPLMFRITVLAIPASYPSVANLPYNLYPFMPTLMKMMTYNKMMGRFYI